MTDIAFFLTSASGGGAERAMIAIANRFAATGYAVDVVLLRRSGPFLDDIDKAIRLVNLEAGKIRRGLLPLARYIRRERPRLLVSPLLGTDILALSGKALFRWKTKVHVSVQNSPTAGAASPELLARHWPRIIRTLYRFADSINGISQGVAAEVEHLMGKPAGFVPVINNPVDIAMTNSRALERSNIEWLSDKAGPVVLAAGRLVPQKDYPTLLQAFALLRRRRFARLIILGEGPDRSAIEGEARALGIDQDLLMPGFAGNPFAAMASADVFVLSSRWEGFANVVAEALACGAKVVSTDCPSGPAEILEQGRYGSLVPIGDPDALARALDSALDAEVDQDALRTRALAFSLDAVFAQYRQLWQSQGLIR